MISLFLNTSSNYLNIAILKDGVILDSIYQKYDRDLSKAALYQMSELISKVGLLPNDIDEVVCVRGPGSFTGLRVGVTIAKTFSYFLDKKLYSVSNLEVMATTCKEEIIVPLIDARRGYVYGAIYDRNYNILMKECYIKLEDLVEKALSFEKKVVFITNDDYDFDTIEISPRIEEVFVNNFKRVEDSITFEPNYLKKTEAEEKLNAN